MCIVDHATLSLTRLPVTPLLLSLLLPNSSPSLSPLSFSSLYPLPPPSPSFPLPLSPFSHQVPMILDPESEGSKVLEYVGGLLSRMDGLQEKAFTYKSYQKSFKVRK